MQQTSVSPSLAESKYDAWFSDFIAQLKVKQLQLETGTAPKEIQDLFNTLMGGDMEQIFKSNDALRQKYFVSKIVTSYLNELNGNLPLKIAFNLNENEVLVWAEIKDDDEALEDKLILAEAKINSQFYPTFTMNSMIVEESDSISIPNHYVLLKN